MHTEFTSGTTACSGPSTRERGTAVGQRSRRSSGGQLSATTQAPSTVLLESRCLGGSPTGGCSASAIPGRSDLSSALSEPVSFSNAVIHTERNP